MTRRSVRAVAALAALGVVLAACGTKATNGSGSGVSPSAGTSSPGKSGGVGNGSAKFTACMVTDTGGIDDRSFNASSWQGVEEAVAADPSKIAGKYLQSTTQSDYVPNITAFINQKCGIIITVGFLMGAATQSAAVANPHQKFAIVDCAFPLSTCGGPHPTPLKNVDSLVFDTVQDGFLGGYLAAGMTKTGKVATFGGEKLPTVTIYMDGFWDGVNYYNTQHHTKVQVLGWSEKTQNGTFTGDFTNQTKGEDVTNAFIQDGADIIFPVAGNVGLGAAQAVKQADAGGAHVSMLWVDTDGCFSAPQFCSYFLSSVTKGIQAAVKHAILSAQNGTFKGGAYVGTLMNGGVVLSPFHDFTSKVPAKLKGELATIKTGIEKGTIKTPTKSPVGPS